MGDIIYTQSFYQKSMNFLEYPANSHLRFIV